MFKASIFLIYFAAFNIYCCVSPTSCQKDVYISYLEIAVDMISKAKDNIPTCTEGNIYQTNGTTIAVDCADVLRMGHTQSGVYQIWIMNRVTGYKPLYVYCDMGTTGGGWTVIQRRGDFKRRKDFFLKGWRSYKRGFGQMDKDFWLGNDNLFALTNQRLYSVRFDLMDFNLEKRYALYDEFWIDDENHKYTLHISNYSGNAGDTMYYVNNQNFSTIDQDNDNYSSYDCAGKYKSGWWYNACMFASLNGLYHQGKHESRDGILWKHWKGYDESLSWSEIKIRPASFRGVEEILEIPLPRNADVDAS